jgi:kynurenine 3-monooxygenase
MPASVPGFVATTPWNFSAWTGDGLHDESPMSSTRYAVMGAGLAGSLMSILLARQGGKVRVFEGRPDPRAGVGMGGKSINLAVSERGLHALEQVGLREAILAQAVPMAGRMIHPVTGGLTFQPYGTRSDQAIQSVSRGALNLALIEAAGREPGVELSFGGKCRDVNPETGGFVIQETDSGRKREDQADALVGADGAFSAVRSRLQRGQRFDYQQSYLTHGYKELTIPPAAGGGFAMEANALHIWPRGGFMMIALPNQDGSFTCTLFWRFTGADSFANLGTGQQVRDYFARTFPDAVPLMPDLDQQFMENPVNSLVTVRCRPWHHGGRIVLIGDACHAVVPFYGQGANAAFEDCVLLDQALRSHEGDREAAFAHYDATRREHVNTLADLALSNFIEMRDATASRLFRGRKRLERILHRLVPGLFVPLYTMVTFTRIPYGDAVERARRQWQVVSLLVLAAVLPLLVVILVMVAGLLLNLFS